MNTLNDDFITDDELFSLQEYLRKNKKTITTAESCTGGLIAAKITSISGSSDIYNGGIISYSNEIKSKELGVNKQTLIDYGAVSVETVKEMLDGALKKFDADYAIATSGIAGPNGGSEKKPVGMVVIGVASKTLYNIDIYYFKGSRIDIQNHAMNKSLKILQFFLKNS